MDEHQTEQLPEGYEPGSDADVHVTSVMFVGVIGAVLIVVIVLLLKALYFQTVNQERMRKEGKGIDVTLSDLRSKQLADIGAYRWVNPTAGTVGLPIDDAMALVVKEESAKPNNGYEIVDWDHGSSDQHPVPGDMLLLGAGEGHLGGHGSFGAGLAGILKSWTQGLHTPQSAQASETAGNADNVSEADAAPPAAAAQAGAQQAQGGEAAGGSK